MLFRLSQKLAKKLKVTNSQTLPLDPNPFADWSAHLFTVDREQFIIVLNTASLYTALLRGRGVSNEERYAAAALSAIREVLIADGLGSIYERFIAPAAKGVVFGTALNRSVTGSMNDLIKCLCWSPPIGPSLTEEAMALNQTPMSMLGMENPRAAFKAMIAKTAETHRAGNGDGLRW
jgi:hypothetical protein